MPAVSLEKPGLDRPSLDLVDRPATFRREVSCVGFGLRLEDAIDRGDQFDELIDRQVALSDGQLSIVANPFEFVEDSVLAFLPPVIEEDVFKQLRESVSGSMLWR